MGWGVKMNRRFTSGITGDYKFFLLNLAYYLEEDASACFQMSRRWNGLPENYYINASEYEDKYLTVSWKGNLFYSTIYDEKVKGSFPIRVFKIYNKEK